MDRVRSRLARKKDKDSLKQAGLYFFLIILLLMAIVKFGLPGLINLAGFIADLSAGNRPAEKQDMVPPLPPRFELLPEATFSSQLNLKGSAEAGTTIQLFINGISAEETVVDNNGEFRFENMHFRDGESEFYATSKDTADNVSQESVTVKIIVDQEAPILEITSPTNNQRFFDKDNPINITGKTEAGAELTINGRFGQIKSEGTFSLPMNLKEGDNLIEAMAKDLAGNETKKSLTVNYTP